MDFWAAVVSVLVMPVRHRDRRARAGVPGRGRQARLAVECHEASCRNE